MLVHEIYAQCERSINRFFTGLVLLVLENHGFSEVKDLPNHQRMAAKGLLHTAWLDLGHPSGPNYRGLVSGEVWSREEVLNQQHHTIASSFNTRIMPLGQYGVHVVNWRGVPAARHQPFSDCQSLFDVWTAAQFDSLLTRTPRKALFPYESHGLWYVGLDDSNNAHSAPLEIADQNLGALLDELDTSDWFNTRDPDTLRHPALFVVYDESFVGDDRVWACWYGRGIRMGVDSVQRNHYSFCSTVCANFGAVPLEHSAGVTPLGEVFADASGQGA